MAERVMVFIDGANLYTCMKDHLDIPKNVKVIVGGAPVSQDWAN